MFVELIHVRRVGSGPEGGYNYLGQIGAGRGGTSQIRGYFQGNHHCVGDVKWASVRAFCVLCHGRPVPPTVL